MKKITFTVSKSGEKKLKVNFIKHSAGKGGWSEWVFPTKKYLFKCCDCGLVHEMEFSTFVAGEEAKDKSYRVIELGGKIRAMFRARRHGSKKSLEALKK